MEQVLFLVVDGEQHRSVSAQGSMWAEGSADLAHLTWAGHKAIVLPAKQYSHTTGHHRAALPSPHIFLLRDRGRSLNEYQTW